MHNKILRPSFAATAVGLMPAAGACSSSSNSSTGGAGGGSGSSGTTASGSGESGGSSGGAAGASTTSAAPDDGELAAGTADVDITVTGAVNAHVTGTKAICSYFFPAEREGLRYEVSRLDYPDLGGSIQFSSGTGAGGGDGPVVIFNHSSGSYTGAATTGSITLAPDLSRADFDVTARGIASGENVQIKGHIAC